MTKYTVVLPIYNAGKDLNQSIRSLNEINYSNFDIIISDNCSNDNSVNILKEIKNEKFKVYFHDNVLNKTDNWNRAYNYAKNSNYLVSLHAGSKLNKNIFNILDDYVSKKTSLIYGRNETVDHNNKPSTRSVYFYFHYKMKNENFKKFLLSDSSVTIIGSTFKAENFFKVGGWNNKYPINQDTEMWLKLSEFGDVKYTPKILGVFKTDAKNQDSLRNHAYYNLKFYLDKYLENKKSKYEKYASRSIKYLLPIYLKNNGQDQELINSCKKNIDENKYFVPNKIFLNYLKLKSIF